MPNYIAYYIDNDDRKIKLMESYSNEKLAWPRVGQVLFLDYSYLDIVIDELQTSDESKILPILLHKIDGFEKFWKEYGKKI